MLTQRKRFSCIEFIRKKDAYYKNFNFAHLGHDEVEYIFECVKKGDIKEPVEEIIVEKLEEE